MTGPGAQGMVRSYRQLKHMALYAGVRCTVAAIVAPDAPAAPDRRGTAPDRRGWRAVPASTWGSISTPPAGCGARQDIAWRCSCWKMPPPPAIALLQPFGARATATPGLEPLRRCTPPKARNQPRRAFHQHMPLVRRIAYHMIAKLPPNVGAGRPDTGA